MLAHRHDSDDRRLRQNVAQLRGVRKTGDRKLRTMIRADQISTGQIPSSFNPMSRPEYDPNPALRDGTGAFMPTPALSPASDKWAPLPKRDSFGATTSFWFCFLSIKDNAECVCVKLFFMHKSR